MIQTKYIYILISLQKCALSKIPELPFGAGPVTSLLDDILQTIEVHRQAYHRRSFVGNHVHKCLKVSLTNHFLFSCYNEYLTHSKVHCMKFY